MEGLGTTNKRYNFRMVLWLASYYDFYDKKVGSFLSCVPPFDLLGPSLLFSSLTSLLLLPFHSLIMVFFYSSFNLLLSPSTFPYSPLTFPSFL